MEAEPLELEDGEVVDDESIDDFGAYKILQRPRIATSREIPAKPTYSDESDETSASASDTDSDSTTLRVKRPKLKVKRRRIESHGTRDKSDKYKIWCTQVQEESLTENLVSCGVTNKLYQGRNVENYDLPPHYNVDKRKNEEEGNNSSEEERDERPRLTNKRTNADRKNVKLRIGKRRNSMEVDGQKGSVRIMAELSVNTKSTDDEVANDIAEKLNEKKDCLIKRVVDIIGKEKSMDFYEKTRKIEEGGGMLIMNGSRRRTAGGIYLWLVKNDEHIPQEKIREIFSMDKKNMEQRKKVEACNRRQKTQELMRSLDNGSEKDLPALLTRAELSTRQIAEEARLRRGEGMDRNLPDSDRTVSNPPPSPVTDDPDHSEQQQHHHHQQQQQQQLQATSHNAAGQRRLQNYNDDFLDIGLDVDSMEVF